MERIFLDASGIVALLNKSDNLHLAAKETFLTLKPPKYHFLTTDIVLTEVGNILSHPRFKQAVSTYIRHLQQSPNTEVIYVTRQTFDLGLERYVQYADQDWGLTDCISFEIMRAHESQQAFTNDHHFQQAGFVILIPSTNVH